MALGNAPVEMVMKYVVVILGIVALIFGNHSIVSAEEIVVGDDQTWGIPDSLTGYSTWASEQIVAVGDTLVFNFATGSHDVALVDKEAFEACDASNAISVMSHGPARVPIKKKGQFYFVCTIGRHCLNGQKLAITVTAPPSNEHYSSSPAPALASASTPTPIPAPAPTPALGLSQGSAPGLTPLTIVAVSSLAFLFLVL